ncbi:unnamed protein product, partial [Ectocarpus sp. 13 AM-2016]
MKFLLDAISSTAMLEPLDEGARGGDRQAGPILLCATQNGDNRPRA